MKKTLSTVVIALLLAACSYAAETNALSPDRWQVTVGAVGTMNGSCNWENFDYGGEVGLGYTIPLTISKHTFQTEAGIRQTVGENASCWSVKGLAYRTEFYWDWSIRLYKGLSLYGGPAISSNYGDMITDWFIGPEVGLRLDLGKNWNLFFRSNYDWNMTSEGNQVWGGSDSFRLTSGVGFRF